MRCVVQCLAETRMSPDEVSKVVVRVANMVFGQNWKMKNEEGEGDEDDEDKMRVMMKKKSSLQNP